MSLNHEFKNRFRILKGGLISLVVASNLYGAPSGGTVMSGDASINQSGNTTNINQTSQKASINWQDFSIKSNETVNFNQPNQNSITLNRVIGNEKSIIDGALNANGQVWLINQNGTLFNKNAKVNTSGLLVTTKNLSDDDFQKGNYSFKGNSKESIENLGNIDSQKYASFIANSVINNGTIKVHSGKVHLIGASEFSVSLDDNSNISLTVNKGVLEALVENNNLIVANDGSAYLTTNAKNELLKGVVNNKGIIEASSLNNLKGEVILFAHGGTANIDGEIKAKGSFVETSADKVKIANNFKVTADKWLIDPVDFKIAASGGDITGTTLSNNLNSADVEIQSTQGSTKYVIENGVKKAVKAYGDIQVEDKVEWTANTKLTLNAQSSIYIDSPIIAKNGQLELKYGQSSADGGTNDYYVNSKVNLKAGNNFSTQKGTDSLNHKSYIVITELGLEDSSTTIDLQGIKKLDWNYVLGADIDASNTKNWIGGFRPIGSYNSPFEGIFDGLGNSISNLYIDRKSENEIGLFGNNSGVIRNVTLKNADIKGNSNVGSLVGINNGIVHNTYITNAKVYGDMQNIGGLVGKNSGTITYSYTSGDIEGDRFVGGLVGLNEKSGKITTTKSEASVEAFRRFGGLVGVNYGEISDSATKFGTLYNEAYNPGFLQQWKREGYMGGLVGENYGLIKDSYSIGTLHTRETGDYTGGLVGYNYEGGKILNSGAAVYITGKAHEWNEGGDKDISSYVGGFVGQNDGLIEKSFAKGDFFSGTALYLGGFVGRNGKTGVISQSFVEGNVSGISTTLGNFVSTNKGLIKDSFAIGTLERTDTATNTKAITIFKNLFALGMTFVPYHGFIKKLVDIGFGEIFSPIPGKTYNYSFISPYYTHASTGKTINSFVTDRNSGAIIYDNSGKSSNLNMYYFNRTESYKNKGWNMVVNNQLTPNGPELLWRLDGDTSEYGEAVWVIGVLGEPIYKDRAKITKIDEMFSSEEIKFKQAREEILDVVDNVDDEIDDYVEEDLNEAKVLQKLKKSSGEITSINHMDTQNGINMPQEANNLGAMVFGDKPKIKYGGKTNVLGRINILGSVNVPEETGQLQKNGLGAKSSSGVFGNSPQRDTSGKLVPQRKLINERVKSLQNRLY